MTDLAEQYRDLEETLTQQKTRRAVLQSKEKEKAEEREKLVIELEAAGIDPTKPREELKRLDETIAENVTTATKAVTEFKAEMDRLEEMAPSKKESKTPVVENSPPLLVNNDDLDLD